METTHRTSWAPVAFAIVILAGLGLLVWFVNSFFGGDGVRVVAIVLGVVALILLINLSGFGQMWAASRLIMRHHDNVLQGIVDFQSADDRGEVVRALANTQRTGNQLDGKILQLAGRLGQQQASAIVGAQRQLTAQEAQAQAGAPTWAMNADVEGDFHMVQ